MFFYNIVSYDVIEYNDTKRDYKSVVLPKLLLSAICTTFDQSDIDNFKINRRTDTREDN